MKLKFINFGPIKEAEFEIKPFTVIAGKNETGKSYILRTLYGIFSSYHKFGNKNLSYDKFTIGSISSKNIEQKFRWIFQQDLGNLVNKFSKERKSIIELISSKGKYSITILPTFKRKINYSHKEILPDITFKYSNFIATPIILDIEKGISLYRSMYPNNYGIPDIYWDILLGIKNVGVADIIELENTYKVIKDLIGGIFEYDQKEGFIFRKGKYKFRMNLVASGIKLFGLFQLLIERNFISQNTLLIIEEPEVHLHPSLRFKLIDVLKTLSENGVYVIFSTHSPEIIRYIEYLLKSKVLTENNTEILYLEKNSQGSIGKREPIFDVLNEVMVSLTENYFNLVIKEQLEEYEEYGSRKS